MRGSSFTDTLILVPTYNEVENISWLLSQLLDLPDLVHVLVVDDSSPDGTASAVIEHEGFGERIHLLQRENRSGLASAYRQAMWWAISNGYERIVQMDADGSHQPADLTRLLIACTTDDTLVVGTRWIVGGRVENWSFHRRALSKGGNLFARGMLKCDINDLTSGFRVWGANALRWTLEAEKAKMSGYGFQIEMAWRQWLAGREVISVPICFVERSTGRSKMSRRIVAEAFWGVIRLRFGGRPQD